MIDALADKIAVSIKDSSPEKTASLPVLKYGLVIMLNCIFTLTMSLIIGFILGMTWEVFITAFSFIVLRTFSGGYHFKTATQCCIASTLIVTIVPLIEITSPYAIIIINILSILLVAIFAPSRIEHQSNIDKKYYTHLKVFSMLIVSANFIFMSDIIALAYFIQSLLLIGKEVRLL